MASLIFTVVGATGLYGDLRPKLRATQTKDGVLLRMDFSHLEDRDWLSFLEHPDCIETTGFGLAGQSGDPALPLFTLLLPVRSERGHDMILLGKDVRIIASAPLRAIPAASRDVFTPDPPAMLSWDQIPNDQDMSIDLGIPITLRGQLFLPVTIKPVALRASTRELEIPQEILLELRGVDLDWDKLVDLPDQLFSMIPNDGIYAQLGHYLILTPPLFEPYIDYLADWKRRKGHPVSIVSTLEAGSTPSAIKSYIQDAYDTWDDPPDYILLIGDEDRGIGGFYVYNPDNEALITDHPFALLDGDDIFPEAWVGRLSVDTITELLTVINKILSYESDPYMVDPGWYQRALLVCTVSAAISPQQVNNWVGRKLTEHGFTEIDTAYYPMQSSLNFVSGPINDGVGFVNYRGLGAWDHWIGPYFYNSDIDALHNGRKLPIMTSIVCGGGNFAASVDPVFGEKWIRAGTVSVPKGAVAFIGPSEVHTHTQFNNVIDIALYSALFDLGINELGPALWYAKQELWRNYHQSQYLPFGQSADFYLSVYNILGDPGMAVWTQTPRAITASFPDTLSTREDHVSVSVFDEDGSPLADAFVYLLNADNAQGLPTDDMGSVLLPFYAGSDSLLKLTITGKNLKPILAEIPIQNDGQTVSLTNWSFTPGGNLIAGGIHGLDLHLRNQGAALDSLVLTLRSSSPVVTLLDSVYPMISLADNDSLNLPDVFSLVVDELAVHGTIVELELALLLESDTLIWQRLFPIQAPRLELSPPLLTSPVGAGESMELQLHLMNSGGAASQGGTITFLNHPLLSMDEPSTNCPSIGIDETQLLDFPGALFLSDQNFPGEELELAFQFASGNRLDTLTSLFTVGQLNRFAPSSSDAYGYRVYDDMDVSYSLSPAYDWVEIDPTAGGFGTRLNIHDTDEEDDEAQRVSLPFTVQYYGQAFDEVTICSNGWMALGASPELSFYNRVIPSPEGPNAMIAPFWDDLITTPGGVSVFSDDDRFIVEWYQVSNLDVQSTLTFQVIIFNTDSYPSDTGDNLIKFQFKDYANYDTFSNFSTTGIESPDYTTGHQVGFNDLVDPSVGELHSAQALLFTTLRAERFEAPVIELDRSALTFEQNPWTSFQDSIQIYNTGGSPLVYDIHVSDSETLDPAPNPVAGYPFSKGGPEPSGQVSPGETREGFDYEWLSNSDAGGPVFSWYDISQDENELIFPGDPDDSSLGPFPLGFDFPFYTESYDLFHFSSNGTISFASDAYPWANLPLPNGSAPPALIAPWWDDLNNNSGVQGRPYYWSNEVDTAVITWDNFPKFGTNDRHTFQLILVANGDILLQYLSMEGVVTSSTVGIQNEEQTKGLQICYNSANDIDDGTAILIRKQAGWFSTSAWTGLIETGETGAFVVTADSRNLTAGNYTVDLILSSNAGNLPDIPLQIDLEVIHGPHPEGDINGDYQVNVLDLVLLMDYVLDIEEPRAEEFERSDLNADAVLNILDVVVCLEIIYAHP